MILKEWDRLPEEFRNKSVKEYYDILCNRKFSLVLKRLFDIFVSFAMLLVLMPVFIVIAVIIKIDSRGPVFYRQVRVTQYGKIFRIFKFRTMVQNADKIGTQVTVNNDSRVTKIGRFLRKYRLDELPQLIDVLRGTMTFVGVRPEVPKYVEAYTDEMMATLLLPAGITSKTSIFYKDESELLDNSNDTDKTYIEAVLPQKMVYNLKGIKNFSFLGDIKIMFMTVAAVLGKDFSEND
ncbi:MAG: sugar transferase [Clostridia bacterium]|nr:sugar transferase [Clostridia bacterium]